MTKEATGIMHFGAAGTLIAPRVITAFASPVTTRETDTGTHVIEGIRIFKSGTFADSMGIVRTWEPIHLDMMAAHFKLLRDGDIFPNVPVRVDHSFSARDVVGYFLNVYRDAEDDTFLAGDIEITEPDAFEKWERGTFRSRSLEVGMYETNGESPQSYFPVVMGLAFVDIPAVEGLHAKGTSPGLFSQPIVDGPQGDDVTHEEFLAACRYAQWVEAATYAQNVADWEAAASYAQAVQDIQEQATALGVTLPTADHSGFRPDQPITFGLPNGQQATMTVAEMASNLGSLMTYRQETIMSSRRSYVEQLAKDGKIGQPQVESMKLIVAGDEHGNGAMTDEQFTAFKKSYDEAGVASLFGTGFGGGGGDTDIPAVTAADEIATLEEIVQNHRNRGATQEEIEKMASFKKLTALKAKSGQG